MGEYKLLNGEVLVLADPSEAEFTAQLAADAASGGDYFDLLRRVKGPDAVPLRGGPITPSIARSALFRVAHDIADRVGIEQGYLLPPDVDPSEIAPDKDLLSLTEAAALIEITRPAAHQAVKEGRLRGRQVGHAWVIRRGDAEAFKTSRPSRGAAVGGGLDLRAAAAKSR